MLFISAAAVFAMTALWLITEVQLAEARAELHRAHALLQLSEDIIAWEEEAQRALLEVTGPFGL